jgi:hypothetical protein
MKMHISVLALALSFTAAVKTQAADRKIGNLIVVERSIDNVYQACVDQFETKKATEATAVFYSCTFETKKTNADIAPATQRVLKLSNPGCEVEGFLQNSIILVSIQIKTANPSIAAARSCVQQAINASPNKDSFKFITYTIE